MLISSRWLGAMGLLSVALTAGCAGLSTSPTTSPDGTVPAPATDTVAAPTPTPTALATFTPQPSPTPDAPTEIAPTSTPTPVPTATATPTPTPIPTRITLEVLEGSKARYLVREQFADQNFPNDAVGETTDVSGSIVFDSDGAVRTEQSMLVVDLRTLDSDDEDRDDFLRGESLESDRYPFAEFVVQEAPGLPWPPPQEGESTFQLVGDMTLHNNTRPLTWEVTAQFSPDQVTGTARTNFTFGEFHMVRPSRFFLLSLEDNIRLELDFIVSVSEVEAAVS